MSISSTIEQRFVEQQASWKIIKALFFKQQEQHQHMLVYAPLESISRTPIGAVVAVLERAAAS